MRGLASLRRFVAAAPPPAPVERCELCAAAVGPGHAHLLEGERRLVCACEACARLFPGSGQARYRPVPARAERLATAPPAAVWDALDLPVGLAVLVRGTDGAGRAIYPGAAGAVEAPVPLDRWQALAASWPLVGELEPLVEALLVDRRGPASRAFRVSVALAYELCGRLRRTWRGLSGGEEAHGGLERWIADLEAGEGVQAVAGTGEGARCPT